MNSWRSSLNTTSTAPPSDSPAGGPKSSFEVGGRLMALDVGEKTVGVAVTDPAGITAQPFKTLARRPDGGEVEAIRELASSLGVKEVVVGLPTRTDGRAGVEVRRVRAFARRVQQACALPVHFVDERFTTVQAERLLVDAGLSRRRRRQAINHVVAAIILETFLARRRVKGEGEGHAT